MNKQILYLECYSGISGDMTVAALLDLGADKTGLQKMLKSIPLSGYEIEISQTEKCGIAACDFNVILKEESQPHRHLGEIYRLIDETKAGNNVKDMAKKIFGIVAEAESKAHNLPVEKVHFHEVGAVDSIVDIMSTAYCLDNLGIEKVVISELYEGTGHVKCQHGILPVPVPAVANIVKSHELMLHLTGTSGEMITPTGAAIAAALGGNAGGQNRVQGRLLKIGIGAGKKDFPHANILRAMIFEEEKEEQLWVLESNIDDCTGEALGYVMEKVLEAGAKDVTSTPIYMKKNRPAWRLEVLTEEKCRQSLENLIFIHTTTIGIRRYRVERRTLDRSSYSIHTSWGEAKVKEITRPDRTDVMPEYESVREISSRTGKSFQAIYEMIRAESKAATRRKKADE